MMVHALWSRAAATASAHGVAWLSSSTYRARGRYPAYEVITAVGNVSAQVTPLELPESVVLPPYAHSGTPAEVLKDADIDVKSPEEVVKLRRSSRLASKILSTVGETLEVGMTTDEVDRLVFGLAVASHAYPSPLNYRGFPKSVCTSVNNVACHGIPDDRRLSTGDIVNVDVTVFLDGFHGDCSRTFLVGNVDDAGRKLVRVTEECLQVGLDCCGPGRTFRGIGDAISRRAASEGFTVVGVFAGHGIGKYFHGPPDIYHVPNSYPGTMLPGMTFTVEPVLSEGCDDGVVILDDGWTAVTRDRARAAQCEHTILVTHSGIDVLTI